MVPPKRLAYDAIMGQRSGTDSVAAVMAAFLRQRKWTQADLAREVELKPEALRKILRQLQGSGYPLEREESRPHVYWRMDKDWYPGGVLFKPQEVSELLRQLARLPRGKARDTLLRVAMVQLPARGKLEPSVPLATPVASEHEEQILPIVEDAAARRISLFMRYVTAHRGQMSERHASVHLIEVGPRARFIATCHRSGALQRFRVDGIVHARLDANEPFREAAPDAVAAFRAASLDGFKGAGPPVACSFFVRTPESNWVVNNLLEGMRPESVAGGARITVETSGMTRLAQFVVGLGDAARPETPALAQAVANLARGALHQALAVLQGSNPKAFSDEAAQPRSDV
jgi:predicted DNA-binding transcriptional regulator YafY